MEPLGTLLAARWATEAEVRAIVELVDNPPASTDAAVLMPYNGAIHRQIYRASHNPVLVRVLDGLSDLVDRHRALAIRRNTDRSVAHRDHREIVDALRSHEAELAARLMREHVAYGFEVMRAAGDGA